MNFTVDAFQTSVFISGELYFNLIIIYFYLELKKVNFNFSSVPKMQLMSTGGLCLIIWFNFYLFLPYYEILIVHCLLIVPIVLLIYDIMRMLLKRPRSLFLYTENHWQGQWFRKG